MMPADRASRPRSSPRWRSSTTATRALALLIPLAALVLLDGAGTALATRTPGTLRATLESEVRKARRVSPDLGVHIVDLVTGTSIFGYDEDEDLTIASNTKLFTTAAALDSLGPAYFFETPLLLRGRIAQGTLFGDLAVVGSGDPNFSGRLHLEDPYGPFRAWARELERRGVERVAGNVYLVHGLFEQPQVHPDWPRDQLTRWYEAPIEALSFNDNCVLVRVEPGARAGAPARVSTVPPLDLFDIRSSARTTGSVRSHWVGVGRAANSNTLNVSGAVYRGAGPVESWVTVADPLAYFGAALRSALSEEGVEIGGEMVPLLDLPGYGWLTVATYRSDLLSTLEVINKRSQNFYAESVLKHLGARRCREGSFDAGARAVQGFLDRVGLERGSYKLVDGSGMSRNNRFAPRHLTRLLREMFYHRHGREFLRTLPYSGEPDLSWERRLAQAPYRGNVFAKTGSLSGVSTLSGYAKAGSGRIYAFSILCNRARSVYDARRSQDRIVAALIDHG